MAIKYKSFNCNIDKSGAYPVITTKYDTLSDFITALLQFADKNPDYYNGSFAVTYSGDSFAGGSFVDAVTVDNSKLEKSITDFSDAARAVAEKLQEQYKTPENYNFDVTGESFDVAEVLSGRPECWFTLPEDKHKKIDIVYNVSLPWYLKSNQIFNRGACLIGLIDALKAAGVNVSLVIVDYSYYRKYNVYKKTFLNIDIDVISPDSLRFICCNPMFLRRLLFCESEILLRRQSLQNISYGRCKTYKPEEPENDTLVISDEFAPESIDDGARKLAEVLDKFEDDGAPQILTI